MRKTLRQLLSALILAAIGVPAFAQTASTPYPTGNLYAASFAQWSLNGQSPNTYVFQGRSLCNSNAQNNPFFVFNTNAPVYIADANTANSEVVTPSAVTNTAGSCGVTIAPANSHYNFQLRSGTGGLQEALNTVAGTNVLPATIFLDRNWYAYVNSIPGKSPASVIGAAAGAVGVVLADITQSPVNFYYWNGAAYSLSGATAGFSNLKATSYTVNTVPTALTTVGATCLTNGGGCITTATTGGTIGASGSYTLGATCVDASGGETTLSTDTAGGATVAVGSGSTNTISVTSPAGCTAANGDVGWRLYMTAASGASLSEILYSPTCTATQLQSVFPSTTVCAIGSTATISAIITGTATVPSLNTAYPRTATSSGSFPPFTAAGTVASTASATLATINIPAGYLNTLGRSIMGCGNGYATNNNTTGTVALTMTVASIPGVTSITPLTLSYTTATTTAVQVPLDFCVTVTTAATGTTGKLEVHGWLNARTATNGTGVAGISVVDNIFAISSSIDLTKQDQIAFVITPTTTGLTAAQIRQLNAYPSN